MSINRRDFFSLGSAAAIVGTAAITELKAEPAPKPETSHEAKDYCLSTCGPMVSRAEYIAYYLDHPELMP